MGTNIKTCVICKNPINTKKDSYCHLIDYNRGQFFMECFYHTKCYNDQIKGQNPDQKAMKVFALKMLSDTNKLLRKAKGEPEEVYTV